MPNQFDFRPGTYRVKVSRLRVRGTMDTSHDGNIIFNQTLTMGKTFPVFHVITDKKGWVWGVITLENASQTHYVCLWDVNTVFAELVAISPQNPDAIMETLKRMESMLNQIMNRLEIGG